MPASRSRLMLLALLPLGAGAFSLATSLTGAQGAGCQATGRSLSILASEAPMPPPLSPQPRREQEMPHGGIQPPLHVQLASLLMQAVVAIVSVFTAKTAASERAAASRPRVVTPCFLDGCVCEEVFDIDEQNRFWMCLEPVIHPEYATGPRVEKGGRWVHYVRAKPSAAAAARCGGATDSTAGPRSASVDSASGDGASGDSSHERANEEPGTG